ncbi:MAG: OmpH family outer membrane protein [Bacteroidota bacterium]
MGRWWQIAAVGVIGVLLGGLGGYLLLRGADRIGMVDMDTILTKSKPGKEYQSKLDARAKELDAELAKITNTQAKLAKREQFSAELTKLQKEYTDKVLSEADKVIARVAKNRGVQAVFVRGTLRYAAVDLTDDVLKEMEK